jgi:hypothetical protein
VILQSHFVVEEVAIDFKVAIATRSAAYVDGITERRQLTRRLGFQDPFNGSGFGNQVPEPNIIYVFPVLKIALDLNANAYH